MTRRHEGLAIACTIAALAGFTACSEDEPTVASSAVVGEWSGTTSQQRSLNFSVSSGGVGDGSFGYVMTGTCNFSVAHALNAAQPLTISDGKFTTGKTQIGTGTGGGAFVTIDGEFTSSTTAKGTFLIQHAPCGDTLNLTWTATKQ
jgi:hypothetical protein